MALCQAFLHTNRNQLPFVVLCAVAVYLSADVSVAMTVSGPSTLVLVNGDQATLKCNYLPDPADTGELDIEWSLVNPDTTKKDMLFLSYSGGSKHFHDNPILNKGVDFATGDPSLFGDASLQIASLTPEHAGTYQCKVKKAPGVDTVKISLMVKERPSVPRCWVQGEPLLGEKVELRCEADRGSSPLLYQWSRESGGPMPMSPFATQNSQLGELLIHNHTLELAGIYSCEVSNDVGKEQCRLNLQALKPPNRAGVIAGTVCGVLLLIIIILIVVWLFIFKRGRRRYEKEPSNDIREDVPAPVSRPSSRASSFPSRAAYSQINHTQGNHPASTGYNASTYDSRFGHVV